MRLGLNHRVRLRIFPAHTRPLWKRLNKMLYLFLGIALVSCGVTLVYVQAKPLMLSLAQSQSSYLATTLIHEAVDSQMQQSSYSYDDLVNIDKTETGQITSITTNVTNMNKLKADIALAVSEKVAELEDTKVAIPLGSLLGSDLFSGTGPRLHVNLVPMGYAHIDFTNSFTEAGINQTKHQIDIIVKVNIGMLMPTGNETVEVSTSVPVAQTVIVGLIPDTYLNLQK